MGSKHCPQGGSPPLPPQTRQSTLPTFPWCPQGHSLFSPIWHTAALRSTHCYPNIASCHQPAVRWLITLPCPQPTQRELYLGQHSHSVPSILSQLQKAKTSAKGTGKVTGLPRHQVMPGAVPSHRKALQGVCHSPKLTAPYSSGPGLPPGLRPPPGDWPEAWGWLGPLAGHL